MDEEGHTSDKNNIPLPEDGEGSCGSYRSDSDADVDTEEYDYEEEEDDEIQGYLSDN